MHIAAADPRFVIRDEVTPDVLAQRERSTASRRSSPASPRRSSTGSSRARWRSSSRGRPMEQPYVKNPDITVKELVVEKIGKMGENIKIRRFARFKLGDGIEKRLKPFGGRDSRPDRKAEGEQLGLEPAYRRILLKLSGEALMGDAELRHRRAGRVRIADEIKVVHNWASRSPSSSVAATSSAARREPSRHRPGDRRPHGHAGDGDQCPGASGRSGEAWVSRPGSRPRSRSAMWPSPLFDGGRCATSRRTGW